MTSFSTKLNPIAVPGDCGLPLIGPLLDRHDFFYNQGRDEFFRSRIHKYKSTVLRTNMPPGPFISSNSNVIALLDAKSFPILFDLEKVDKNHLFTGTYMPSTHLTGGYTTLSYLDPAHPTHASLKNLIFFMLSYSGHRIIPEFRKTYAEMFDTLENELAGKGKADFGAASDQAAFNFLARSFCGCDPRETALGSDGPKIIAKWLVFQLHPLVTLGLPRLLEELLLHTFRLPPFLIKKDYQRLYDFFVNNSSPVLDEAEKLGLTRDEACHNIIFATCFNSFGGLKRLFPDMLKWIGQGGTQLQLQLATEIRSAIRSNGGELSMAAMENMPVMKSVVYEVLRINPPVQFQYGKAKHDLVIESHDAAYRIAKGELLFGYQPFATKDPRVFDRAEEFIPERFVGGDLLKYVVWSNGPETEDPTVNNKQCAGKDFVVLVSRLLLVELFRRYDSFQVEAGSSPLGTTVQITAIRANHY